MPRVWCTRLASALSPPEAMLRLASDDGIAWLDGGLHHGREGRFSFVASQPVEVRAAPLGAASPLSLLGTLGAADDGSESAELDPADVPRWIGHVAYDAHPVARARFRHILSATLPGVHFARYDALLAFDHAQARAYLVGDDEAACARLALRLDGPRCRSRRWALRWGR